jgi:NAD+ kinase
MKRTESLSATPQRSALLVIHPTRPDALEFALELIKAFAGEGIVAATNFKEAIPDALQYDHAANYEVAVVLGGDGTILRAAELVLGKNIPVLGINLGNVGFLAEIQRPSAQVLAHAIGAKNYRGESRLLLNYRVFRDDQELESGWALNELVIERSHSQMAELFVQIDDRPLSRWGCDGVICATPTGSTAYAFSAGGPVLWPEVEAIVVLPLAAHALFSRPMVISPQSVIVIDVESAVARISADGFRTRSIQKNDRVIIQRSVERIELLHIESAVFTDRLVAKFKLPIEGWRGE